MNDTTDAEAISEAAQRPIMNFVAVKTAEQQARVSGGWLRGGVCCRGRSSLPLWMALRFG